jgi:large subunit ribosomal protein L15e
MGLSKYISKTFQKEWAGKEDADYNYGSLMQKRAIDYRKETLSVVKIDKPTNIVSARQVGYKAKEGVFVARVKVRKGAGTHTRPKNKRRPKRQGKSKLTRRKSTQSMAEEKASKKFENSEAIGSYKINEDGRSHFYEVVLVDRMHPSIEKDKELSYLLFNQKGRAERGKTFSGRVNKEINKKVIRKRKFKKALQKKVNASK